MTTADFEQIFNAYNIQWIRINIINTKHTGNKLLDWVLSGILRVKLVIDEFCGNLLRLWIYTNFVLNIVVCMYMFKSTALKKKLIMFRVNSFFVRIFLLQSLVQHDWRHWILVLVVQNKPKYHINWETTIYLVRS